MGKESRYTIDEIRSDIRRGYLELDTQAAAASLPCVAPDSMPLDKEAAAASSPCVAPNSPSVEANVAVLKELAKAVVEKKVETPPKTLEPKCIERKLHDGKNMLRDGEQ